MKISKSLINTQPKISDTMNMYLQTSSNFYIGSIMNVLKGWIRRIHPRRMNVLKGWIRQRITVPVNSSFFFLVLPTPEEKNLHTMVTL